MKKRVANRKGSSSLKKPSRNFSVLQWVLLAIIIIAVIFLVYKVSMTGRVATGNAIQLDDAAAAATDAKGEVQSYIVNMFTKWGQGNTDVIIAKYAFIILVCILIFGISAHMPFLKGNWYLQLPFAILVGFLAGAYLTPSDVYTMLTGYGAMGLILGGIIPFIIVGYFSLEMGKEGIFGKWTSIIIWIGFVIFIIYKLILGLVLGKIGAFEGIIYGLLVLVSFIVVLAYDKIQMKMYKAGASAGVREATKTQIAQWEAKIGILENDAMGIDPNDPDYRDKQKRISGKIEQLKELIAAARP